MRWSSGCVPEMAMLQRRARHIVTPHAATALSSAGLYPNFSIH